MDKLKIALNLTLLANFLLPSVVFAQTVNLSELNKTGFNPNYIISDTELTAANSLSLEEIKNFLNNKPGILKNYEIIDPNTGLNQTAAEIIFEASQKYQINPKVLLVLLQKEQSLIENPHPSKYNFDWATGYSRCDACDANDPALAKFKGFASQVDYAAGALRFYLDNNQQEWLKKIGLIYNIDSVPVIPANLATAGLYTYTPHLNGNFNFWQIWQRWFSALKFFPDGVIVRAKDDSQIWLIKNGKRHPLSTTAFNSRWKANEVLTTIPDLLEQYEVGPKIKYPNFSLVKNETGEIYLLAGGQKRLIDKAAFRYFGFDPEEVRLAEADELTVYENGEPILKNKKYPLGIVLKNQKTRELYYVENDAKHPILDKNMLKRNLAGKKIRNATNAALKKFADGAPLKFEDGTLLKIKNSPEIYLISDGERRLIQDELTFETFGLNWKNILTISEATLELHPQGEPISLPSSAVPILAMTNQ